MVKEILSFMYDWKERRFRGSFVHLLTTVFLYGAYSLILFLIYHQIYMDHSEKLADLSTLILGTFGSLSGVQAYSSVTYYNNREKSRANKYARVRKEQADCDSDQQEP